jgi:hypothetical protein
VPQLYGYFSAKRDFYDKVSKVLFLLYLKPTEVTAIKNPRLDLCQGCSNEQQKLSISMIEIALMNVPLIFS